MNYRYSAPGQNTAAGGEMENLEERSWIMNPTGCMEIRRRAALERECDLWCVGGFPGNCSQVAANWRRTCVWVLGFSSAFKLLNVLVSVFYFTTLNSEQLIKTELYF